MNSTPRRRLTTSAIAMTMVLPLGVVAVGAPASAAIAHLHERRESTVQSVEQGWDPYAGYGSYGGYGGSVDPYAGAYSGPTTGTTGTTDTTDATAAQSTGVVEISTTLDFGAGEAAGTGMVLDSDGIVVTNHHVVAGATTIEVTVPTTGATYDATVIGTNAVTDVAVLQLQDASGLATVSTASDSTSIGQAVTAVGDAGGDGGSLTAAEGTITGLGKNVTVQDETDGGTTTLKNLIEVDADIIPGDSGGALLDASGDVVGMNVAASSGAQAITGYVIPISRVLRIADQILDGDAATNNVLGYSGFLGVQLSSNSESTLLSGVVADGPAAAAGLAAGDTVTAFDGEAVTTATELRELIATYDAGDRVRVSWTDAAGTSHAATVTLTQAPVA